jgi:probable HAF family extracellular repeat protein
VTRRALTPSKAQWKVATHDMASVRFVTWRSLTDLRHFTNREEELMKVVNSRRLGKVWKLSFGLATLVLLSLGTAIAQTTYTVTDLGTLGGTFGCAMGINNKHWVEFMDTLPQEQLHAGLWVAGLKIDLGTFGGQNLNSSMWYGGVNERGQAVGYAETSELAADNFCGFGTGLQCLPFLWQNGVMAALPTLGGTNGVAAVINNRGQVVGTAENTTPDPSCSPFQSAPPVLWEKGQPQELRTYPGDPDGIALSINNHGQAVGSSGSWCATLNHALLWENGTVTDLPSLGGALYNIPYAINDQGQVVGVSDLAGDTAAHAVLWQGGIASDLGTLPGDSDSEADGINADGQVVGVSCGATGCSATLWQDGTVKDLNNLIPAGSSLYLFWAHAINSSGEIVGMALWNGTSDFHAFVATPTNPDTADGNAPLTPGATRQRPKVTLPENVRKLLQRRLGFGRFGWLARPQ